MLTLHSRQKDAMHRLYSLPLFVLTALVLASCDNPVGSDDDDDHDHEEVAGYVLISEGDTLVTVRNAAVTGSIPVPLGASTESIEVVFTDDDDHEIHDDDFDDSFSVRIEVENESLLDIDQPSRWTFSFSGLEAGTTAAHITLMHVSHEEFRTPTAGIPVIVQ